MIKEQKQESIIILEYLVWIEIRQKNYGERKVFEKLYLGLIYTGHDDVFNDVDGGIYVYIKMRRFIIINLLYL